MKEHGYIEEYKGHLTEAQVFHEQKTLLENFATVLNQGPLFVVEKVTRPNKEETNLEIGHQKIDYNQDEKGKTD